jgi:hypothetical protein
MSKKMSRRQALSATAAAAAGVGMMGCAHAATGTMSSATAPTDGSTPAAFLPDVWGEDFMLQWSPPDDLRKDLTVGTQHIRVSCASYSLRPRGRRGEERKPWDVQVKAVREAGFTAFESGGWSWNAETVTDSDVREIRALCKEFDVEFNTLHVWANMIHPDPQERNLSTTLRHCG